MTMTYSWEKNYNPWHTEPDFFDTLEVEESENEKADALSIEDISADEDIELDEDFDL